LYFGSASPLLVIVVVVLRLGVDHAQALLGHREHDLHHALLDGALNVPVRLGLLGAVAAAAAAAAAPVHAALLPTKNLAADARCGS